jgi:hypothetical protein
MFVLLQSIASLALPPVKDLVRATLDIAIGTGESPARSELLPRRPVLKAVLVKLFTRKNSPADSRIATGVVGFSLLQLLGQSIPEMRKPRTQNRQTVRHASPESGNARAGTVAQTTAPHTNR